MPSLNIFENFPDSEDDVGDLFDTRDMTANESRPQDNDSEDDSSDGDEDIVWDADEDGNALEEALAGEDEEGEDEVGMEGGNDENTAFVQKVQLAVQLVRATGLDLVDVLDAISWGNEGCTQNAYLRAARTAFLRSPKLPGILRRWAVPPRPKKGKKHRPKGASDVMKAFAVEQSTTIMNSELKTLAPDLLSPPSVDVEKEALTDTTFDDLSHCMQTSAPTTWNLIKSLATRPRQAKRNTHKRPDKVCCHLYLKLQ